MGFICKINYLRLFLGIFTAFVGISVAEGTSFTVVPLETQVQNAEGVIWGKFRGSASKKVAGNIVTEADFELMAVSGIMPSEIVNKNNFKIIYPGGIWQGIVYATLGAPRFGKNEEVVLFVTKGPYGYQLANLGLSKYLVIRNNQEKIFLRNSIFPEHPELGKVSLEKLNDLLEDRFQQSLSAKIVEDKHIYRSDPLSSKRYIKKKNNGASLERRSPASDAYGEKAGYQKKSYQGIIWIILMFSILGGYFVMAKRGE